MVRILTAGKSGYARILSTRPPHNMCFPGPTWVHIQNGTLTGSAVFAGLTAETNRQTDRQTIKTQTTKTLGNNRPQLCTLCMQCGLIITIKKQNSTSSWWCFDLQSVVLSRLTFSFCRHNRDEGSNQLSHIQHKLLLTGVRNVQHRTNMFNEARNTWLSVKSGSSSLKRPCSPKNELLCY